jgi:uncharacterized C2H2 Zn-finger protein
LERSKKNLMKTEKALQSATQMHADAKEQVAQDEVAARQLDDAYKALGSDGASASKDSKETPTPKGQAKAASTKTVKSLATEGRREGSSGKRPSIKEIIKETLGNNVMSATQVYDAIKAKGQLPNSNDPRGYIGYLLSGSKTVDPSMGSIPLWERVPEAGRGFYRNRGVKTTKVKTDTAPKVESASKKATEKSTPKPRGKSPDRKNHILQLKQDNPSWNAPKIAGEVGCSAAYVYAVWGKGTPVKKVDAPKTLAKSAPAKSAAPKTTDGKRTVKCTVCGQLGHNSRGHDKFVAKTHGTKVAVEPHIMVVDKTLTNGTKVAVEPHIMVVDKTLTNGSSEAKLEPAKVEAAPAQTADEILAEAGIDLGPAI